jgi:hypothetical protein
MFKVADVSAVLRRVTLRIEDDEDDEVRRMCESTFRIGLLTFDLAQSIEGIHVVRQCFNAVEGRPLWEVNDVRFTPPSARYVVTLKSAPDMPRPLTELVDAEIDLIRVWRPREDNRDLSLEFRTRHALSADIKDLGDLITAWERRTTYVTLTEMRPPLFEDIDKPATNPNKRTH